MRDDLVNLWLVAEGEDDFGLDQAKPVGLLVQNQRVEALAGAEASGYVETDGVGVGFADR